MKTLVSTNVGNGYSKAVSSAFIGEGQRKAVVFPSIGALEQGAVSFDAAIDVPGNGHKDPDLIIEYRGERWALGDAAYAYGRMQVQDMSRSRIETGHYQLLYAATLAATVRNSNILAVVASLPIAWYNSDRESARQILSGEFTVRYAGKTRTYSIAPNDCYIIPEGLGALCNRVLTEDGKVADPDMAKARVGVIDVGTRTVGFLRVDHLKIIPAKSDMRDDLGMSTVWTLMREVISRNHGRTLNDAQIDEALHARAFRDSGHAIDIGDDCDRATQALASAIAGRINSLWDNGREVDYLYLTGGGAQFVAPFLTTYSNVEVSECGYFDNAEGGLRFGLARGFAND
jgi:plasmid segregation protein ParM